MSIARLAAAAASRGTTSHRGGGNRGSGSRQPLHVASLITDYLPSEIIAAYTACSTALGGASRGSGQWVLLATFALLTPVAIVAVAKRDGAGSIGRAVRTPEVLAGLLAFLVWSFGLPGSPFARFSWYRPGLASVVLVLSLLLIPVALIFFFDTDELG